MAHLAVFHFPQKWRNKNDLLFQLWWWKGKRNFKVIECHANVTVTVTMTPQKRRDARRWRGDTQRKGQHAWSGSHGGTGQMHKRVKSWSSSVANWNKYMINQTKTKLTTRPTKKEEWVGINASHHKEWASCRSIHKRKKGEWNWRRSWGAEMKFRA